MLYEPRTIDAYMISNCWVGAPLQELLDDGLLVQGGGDVQSCVAVLIIHKAMMKIHLQVFNYKCEPISDNCSGVALIIISRRSGG